MQFSHVFLSYKFCPYSLADCGHYPFVARAFKDGRDFGSLTDMLFDYNSPRLTLIMNDETFDTDPLMKGVTRQSLLYHWMLRSLGYDVEGQIKTLEAEVYGAELNNQYLSQRDIDELQLLLSLADGVKGRDNGFKTKAIVFDLKYIKVRINKEANHTLPHFYIDILTREGNCKFIVFLSHSYCPFF